MNKVVNFNEVVTEEGNQSNNVKKNILDRINRNKLNNILKMKELTEVVNKYDNVILYIRNSNNRNCKKIEPYLINKILNSSSDIIFLKVYIETIPEMKDYLLNEMSSELKFDETDNIMLPILLNIMCGVDEDIACENDLYELFERIDNLFENMNIKATDSCV